MKGRLSVLEKKASKRSWTRGDRLRDLVRFRAFRASREFGPGEWEGVRDRLGRAELKGLELVVWPEDSRETDGE
jgi:hypothetical protein